MGLLADAFSYGDTLKRKVRGLLDDPRGTVEQMVGQIGDDNNKNIANMQLGYGIGKKPLVTVLADSSPYIGSAYQDAITPSQRAASRDALAEYGAQSGIAGAVNLPSGLLSSSIGDAKNFASKVEGLGKFRANVDQASGGSVYVTFDKSIGRNKWMPINFKARFADHPSYWGNSISSDPITQNSVDTVFGKFKQDVLGDAPVVGDSWSQARFDPRDKFGSVKDFNYVNTFSLKGNPLQRFDQSDPRPFTFLDRFIAQ